MLAMPDARRAALRAVRMPSTKASAIASMRGVSHAPTTSAAAPISTSRCDAGGFTDRVRIVVHQLPHRPGPDHLAQPCGDRRLLLGGAEKRAAQPRRLPP